MRLRRKLRKKTAPYEEEDNFNKYFLILSKNCCFISYPKHLSTNVLLFRGLLNQELPNAKKLGAARS